MYVPCWRFTASQRFSTETRVGTAKSYGSLSAVSFIREAVWGGAGLPSAKLKPWIPDQPSSFSGEIRMKSGDGGETYKQMGTRDEGNRMKLAKNKPVWAKNP